jgi:hypothetical protein
MSCVYNEHSRVGTYGEDAKGAYRVEWIVVVRDNTAEKVGAHPIGIIERCNGDVTGTADNITDPVPVWGASYVFLDSGDLGSFCQSITAEQVDKADQNVWKVTADYRPPKRGSSQQRIQEKNPLSWPPEVSVKWNSQDKPIEQAYCYSDMPQVHRGVGSDRAEPGPIMNAVGQQTIDPQMKTVYHPILTIKRNYASWTTAITLNNTYQGTTNNDVFLGGPARCFKFLVAESEALQQKQVEGVGLVNYYPTTIQIEFKSDTWDLLVLNNGLVCFQKKLFGSTFLYVKKDGTSVNPGDQLGLFPCQIPQSASNPTPVDASDPVNLDLDGTQLYSIYGSSYYGTPMATHITYRYLTEVDYSPFATGLPP